MGLLVEVAAIIIRVIRVPLMQMGQAVRGNVCVDPCKIIGIARFAILTTYTEAVIGFSVLYYDLRPLPITYSLLQ